MFAVNAADSFVLENSMMAGISSFQRLCISWLRGDPGDH
jgi:hypothetical protein